MQAGKSEKGGGPAGAEAEPSWAAARTENALGRDFTVNAIMCAGMPAMCLPHRAPLLWTLRCHSS